MKNTYKNLVHKISSLRYQNDDSLTSREIISTWPGRSIPWPYMAVTCRTVQHKINKSINKNRKKILFHPSNIVHTINKIRNPAHLSKKRISWLKSDFCFLFYQGFIYLDKFLVLHVRRTSSPRVSPNPIVSTLGVDMKYHWYDHMFTKLWINRKPRIVYPWRKIPYNRIW